MPKVILTATTAADQSEDFTVADKQGGLGTLPAHFTCPGMENETAKVATVQKKNADGSYSNYSVDDVLQQITPGNTGVVVYAPGVYRVDKDATAAACPVEVSTDETP